jgi:3-phosphoshikimate 1-carboxyvinyltransferase
MGANIEYLENSVKVTRKDKLKGLDIDCKEIPDAAMTLAVMAIFAKGKTELRNIGSWRVKETDRIHAMETELKKLGAHVTSTIDSISISPPSIISNNVVIDTYNDHRMAMCFSLVTLANKTVTINEPECVNKTYPEFFKDFEAVTS